MVRKVQNKIFGFNALSLKYCKSIFLNFKFQTGFNFDFHWTSIQWGFVLRGGCSVFIQVLDEIPFARQWHLGRHLADHEDHVANLEPCGGRARAILARCCGLWVLGRTRSLAFQSPGDVHGEHNVCLLGLHGHVRCKPALLGEVELMVRVVQVLRSPAPELVQLLLCDSARGDRALCPRRAAIRSCF